MKIISEEKKAKIKNRHHSIKTQMIMAFRTADLPGSDINVHQWQISGTILYQQEGIPFYRAL